MPAPRLSRRDFLKCSVVAGIGVYIAAPGSAALAALFERERLRPLPWDARSGTIRYRTDATAKVTGEKVFSFDMRGRDLPGWPDAQSHAMLLRTTRADSVYAGFDLSLLGDSLRPDRIVTAADLQRDGVAFPAFYGEDMLLPEGRTPAYLGHAVALLVWHDFARFRAGKNALRFRDNVIRWGARTGPLDRPPWAAFRYVRVGGATAFDDDAYSSLKDTPLFPSGFDRKRPLWPQPNPGGSLDAQGAAFAARMSEELSTPSDATLVLEREYFSQSIDTAALELDNGNAWFDAANATLHLVSATQSPQEVAEAGAIMLSKIRLAVNA